MFSEVSTMVGLGLWKHSTLWKSVDWRGVFLHGYGKEWERQSEHKSNSSLRDVSNDLTLSQAHSLRFPPLIIGVTNGGPSLQCKYSWGKFHNHIIATDFNSIALWCIPLRYECSPLFVFMCVQVWMCVCACKWRPEDMLGFNFSQALSVFLWSRVSPCPETHCMASDGQ